MRMKNILRKTTNFKVRDYSIINTALMDALSSEKKIEEIRLFHKRMRLKNRPTE